MEVDETGLPDGAALRPDVVIATEDASDGNTIDAADDTCATDLQPCHRSEGAVDDGLCYGRICRERCDISTVCAVDGDQCIGWDDSAFIADDLGLCVPPCVVGSGEDSCGPEQTCRRLSGTRGTCAPLGMEVIGDRCDSDSDCGPQLVCAALGDAPRVCLRPCGTRSRPNGCAKISDTFLVRVIVLGDVDATATTPTGMAIPVFRSDERAIRGEPARLSQEGPLTLQIVDGERTQEVVLQPGAQLIDVLIRRGEEALATRVVRAPMGLTPARHSPGTDAPATALVRLVHPAEDYGSLQVTTDGDAGRHALLLQGVETSFQSLPSGEWTLSPSRSSSPFAVADGDIVTLARWDDHIVPLVHPRAPAGPRADVCAPLHIAARPSSSGVCLPGCSPYDVESCQGGSRQCHPVAVELERTSSACVPSEGLSGRRASAVCGGAYGDLVATGCDIGETCSGRWGDEWGQCREGCEPSSTMTDAACPANAQHCYRFETTSGRYAPYCRPSGSHPLAGECSLSANDCTPGLVCVNDTFGGNFLEGLFDPTRDRSAHCASTCALFENASGCGEGRACAIDPYSRSDRLGVCAVADEALRDTPHFALCPASSVGKMCDDNAYCELDVSGTPRCVYFCRLADGSGCPHGEACATAFERLGSDVGYCVSRPRAGERR